MNGDIEVAEDFVAGCSTFLMIKAPKGSTVANNLELYFNHICPPEPETDPRPEISEEDIPTDAGDEEGGRAAQKGGGVGDGDRNEQELAGPLREIRYAHGDEGEDQQRDDEPEEGAEERGRRDDGAAEPQRGVLPDQDTQKDREDKSWTRPIFIFFIAVYWAK